MLVKDQFKRITWEELFDYNYSANHNNEESPAQKIFNRSTSQGCNGSNTLSTQNTSNPFSKKNFSTATEDKSNSTNKALKVIEYNRA